MNNESHAHHILLQQLQEGRQAALQQLMRLHYDGLFDYASRFCSCESLVKDAIQEVFIGLWQKRSTATTIGFLKAYLLGAVRNQVLKSIRLESRYKDLDSSSGEISFAVDYSIEDKLVNRQDSELRSIQLRKVLEQLSPRQKEVVYLRYFQDQDPATIAVLLQLNQQSVYNLLHEALRKLRQCWHSGILMRAV